MLKTGLDVVQ